MQKAKRKCVDQTQTKDYAAYQSRCRSTKERKELDTTEPNNNYMNETKDAALADRMKIDSTSEMMEPLTKVICNRTRRGSNEFALDTTETNDYSESNVSNASVSNLLQEIDSILEKVKPKTNSRRESRNTLQNKLSKLEPLEVNNNPSCGTDIPSGNQVETDSIPKMSQPKSKCTRKRRGKSLKKLVTSKEIVIDNNSISETKDTTSESLLEVVSMPDAVPKENLTCKLEGTAQEKVMKSEPATINDSPECENDLTSGTLEPEPKYTRKPRGRAAKKVIKLMNILIDGNPMCESGATSSDNWMEINSIAEKEKPEKKCVRNLRNTERKTLVKTEPMEINNNPELETKNAAIVTEIQTDLMLEISRPETKRIYKGRGRQPKKGIKSKPMEMNKDISLKTKAQSDLVSGTTKAKAKRGRKPRNTEKKILVKSKQMEINNNPESETKNRAIVTQIQTDLMSETIKTRAKRRRKPRNTEQKILVKSKQMGINNNPESETKNRAVVTQIQTDLMSETIKTRAKRERQPRAKEPEVVMRPDAMETCHFANETKNTPLDNGSVSKLVSTLTKAEIKPGIKKSEAGRPRKIKTSEKIEMNNNLASETEHVPPKSYSQTNSVSEIPVIKDQPNYCSEKKSQGIEPETDPIDDNTEKNKNVHSSPDNHNISYSIPKTVENKQWLLDNIYQPKVLLWNVAYSGKLSPKQREMLSKNHQSQKCLSLKIIPDSTTGQSMEQSTLDDIINASAELGKKNGEPILQGDSSVKSCDNELSNPEKKKGPKTTQSNMSTLESWDAMYTSKSCVRNPETNSNSANETDVLSSVGNGEFSIQQQCSPSPGLFLEESSLTHQNNFEKKLPTLIVPPDEQIQMWVLPEIMELGVPLDLSIQNSEKSMSNQSEFSKSNDKSIRELCSETNESKSQHMNVHNIGFGNSTLNVTNLSTSFTDCEINEGINPTVPENISELSKNINVCEKLRLQTSECQDEILMFHISPEPPKVLPITSAASKRQTKQASVKPKKLLFQDTLSLKVSLPAEHYFNKQYAMRKELNTIVKKEKASPRKVQIVSHSESSDINHRITDHHDKINLLSVDGQTLTGENSDQGVGLPTTLPNLCKLNDNVTACESTFSESVLEPLRTISNIRSLPTIVVDELLPKGTITLSSISCKSKMPNIIAAKIGNESSHSKNINEMNENKKVRELTIHKQSAYTSSVNISQSKTTTICWNHAHASDNMSDINGGSDTADNLYNFKNSHRIMSGKFPENMKTDATDQNSVVDHHFDPTQLWKICPEFENYFSQDDDVVNNHGDRLSNFYTLNNGETNCNDNSVNTLSTEMETGTNIDNNTDLPTNNVRYIPENANNIQDVFESVIDVNLIDRNEMEVELSECIATQTESNSKKCSVIANLTTANLRHFNNISSNDVKDRLNRCSESCNYYLSQGDITKYSNKSMLDVVVETSCEAMESTSESKKEFSQAESKKRKRKWIEDEKSTSLKPVTGKRLKLNRNTRSIEGQDLANVNNSPKTTSIVSINSDNFIPIHVVGSTRSPKKTGNEELNTVKRRLSRELIVVAERIETRQDKYNCKSETIVNCTTTNDKEDIKISTTIPASTVDSGTLKCELGNNSRLQGELCITSHQNFQNDGSNSGVDRNGNFTSMSSSSSSSSLQNSKPISNHSKNSDTINIGNYKPEPYENECQKKEEMEEELDADCISLFAESVFTNFDQATNLTDVISISPLLDVKECDENFQDMSDVGAYFDKNVQECNEAYESCKQQMNMNMQNSHIVPDAFKNVNHARIIPQLLRENLIQLNFNQSKEYVDRESYPSAIILQKSNLSNIANLKDRLSETRGSTHVSVCVKSLFDWHCFQKLRQGSCHRTICRFYHHLGPGLQKLEQRDPELINEVIDFAISNGYNYFIQHIYPQIIMQMDYFNTIKLFYQLSNNGLMSEYLIQETIAAVTKNGISLREFLSDIAQLLNQNDNILVDCILQVIAGKIEQGAYWDTCRDLLVRMKPSNLSINRVISECIYNKDKLAAKDVYINYVKRFTVEQVSCINAGLREQFDLLLKENNLIHEAKHPSQPPLFENVNLAERKLKINVTEHGYNEDQIKIPTILSPDDTAHHNYENSIQLSPGIKHSINQKFSSQESSDMRSFMKNQSQGSNSTECNHSFHNQSSGAATPVSSVVEQHSPGLNTRASESGASLTSSASFNSSFKLHQIDDLPPPQSAFRDRHWRFYLTMNNLKEALKHQEYLLALKILNRYSEMDQTIFTSSCYKMLRETVMASPYHVKNMIKLSVRMGYNKFLNETLFTFGMYTMIKLCNSHAWVLAYSLFKFMRRYSAPLTENIAAFALISAEICLANRRPLKAFTILKQNNMLCTSRSKWHVVSDPNDEHVRVMIINLLVDVLCEEYPDRAFYIFTYLLKDQTRIYHPIDLTAYINKLVTGILKGKCNDLITDVGKLIIENHFTLENSVFQSLVIKVFQYDLALCRQLYCYGTWVGVYPIVKLMLPLHILIKTNWTREEMYLVVIDFLEKLSMDIGPTIDRIGPNQFTIHLVFELAPFKQQLPENNDQISNKDELKMSKELMKTVLRERFNPPLLTIIAERERFMKLQSRSVVNYLKSMII